MITSHTGVTYALLNLKGIQHGATTENPTQPTIKSPEKDTRQMDLGNAQDGNPKKSPRHAEVKIHPARCSQPARDVHWT